MSTEQETESETNIECIFDSILEDNASNYNKVMSDLVNI
jgi:hypothetical protein